MVNWRILTIGALMMGFGSWFRTFENSEWIRATIPIVSDFFREIHVLSIALVLAGSVIAVYGLFWGRWIISTVLGLSFAIGVFVVSFMPA